MRKLFETISGRWGTIFLDAEGKDVDKDYVLNIINSECNPLKIGYEDGVLVSMSKEEYGHVREYLEKNKPN